MKKVHNLVRKDPQNKEQATIKKVARIMRKPVPTKQVYPEKRELII
jgi:hypothetical protein